MIRIIDKGTINREIIPHLTRSKRGCTQVNLWEIVNAILYKLYTGVQWHLLPVKSLIYNCKIKYGAIYHHFRKWVKDGSWNNCFEQLLLKNRHQIDLSIAHFDGTHTVCKKGGEAVDYQHRKRAKTSNTLWLVDRQGLPIGFSQAVSGNHHDLYQSENVMIKLENRLQKSQISMQGLFINMDAGFDSKAFRSTCESLDIQMNAPINKKNNKDLEVYDILFDEELYKSRYVVERTNAWMDKFRNILIRMDTSASSWNACNNIAAITIWCQKVLKL